MIIPDVNLLVYAYNDDTPFHAKAKDWWEAQLNTKAVGLPWAASLGFVRLMTHPKVVSRPLSGQEAVSVVESWLALPQVRIAGPGSQHLAILATLFGDAGKAASLTTDAHLAAIAIEYQAELHSNDQDFGRYSGLKWVNPLAS